MCWLYSMSNLLVIQHVDTLYLGGNNVRVVCERVWRNSSCMLLRGVSWLDLVTDSRLASRHTCEACRERKGHDSWSTTGQNVQSALEVISWLKLETRSSREAKLPEYLVWMKTDFSHSISYPVIYTLIPTKCRHGYSERKTLRELSTTHPPH